jgi:DnaJ-class molecular chaperone
MKDLYKTLGVAESADEAAIKKAYRKLAKEYHPDVTGNDKKKTERFKEINEAYAVLGEAQKRKEYDRLKHAPVRPDGMPEGFDADAFARTFGGARAAAGGVEFNGDFDVGDIFASLFGGGGAPGGGRRTVQWGGRGARPRQSRGADVIGQLPISFAEAALGTKRTIRAAGGDAIDISVPSGVENGGRLRVPGKGAKPSGDDGVPGDLYLDLEVRPDPFLRRAGDDVELDLPVTISEAVLGAKVEVPTVEGPVTVTIPPGTSSGARLRLRGRGVKNPDGSRGDQIVRVEIMAPKIRPDDTETRKLFEQIAERTGKTPVRRF